MFCRRTVLFAGVSLIVFPAAEAFSDEGLRGAFVEAFVTERPEFMVRVSVDKADHTYSVGEQMTVTVRSARRGYLYLLYLNSEGKVSVLFPNKHQTENVIPANRDIQVPSEDAPFRITMGLPVGNEMLKAVVTEKPLNNAELNRARDGVFAPVSAEGLRGASVTALRRDEVGARAEHSIRIVTREKRTTQRHTPRRIAVCIGLGTYADPTVNKIPACAADAVRMGNLLRTIGGFDEVVVLTDGKATRAAIELLLSETLPEKTRPGDEICLYWSGHGGQREDLTGREADGLEEWLVCHDTDCSEAEACRRSSVSDDLFGRWIQALDGRRIVVIVDSCHSGGLVRGPSSGFLQSQQQQIKDIGQAGTAVLTSSAPDQQSFIRQESDLSVMTYYLIESVENASGPLTLADVHSAVSGRVKRYTDRYSRPDLPLNQTVELHGGQAALFVMRPDR